MEIETVKFLVETYPRIELEEAQEAILNGKAPEMEVSGYSEAEKLSQLIAAIWVLEKMNQEQVDFVTAFEAYGEGLK